MPGFSAAFMASLNDHNAWVGNIDDMIALSIRESGMPLVDLTRGDNKAGTSGTVKEEPDDERNDPYKHFCRYSERIACHDRRLIIFSLSLV
jgi:hypothetical protein